jgi:xeroderma pigmentosum group C-complementing protein
VSYAISVEHDVATLRLRLTDVTPRYAQSWIASLRKRGTVRTKHCEVERVVQKSWWTQTLQIINATHRPRNNVGRNNKAAVICNDRKAMESQSAKVAFPDGTCPLDDLETEELATSAKNEAIPTSKADFKTHPIYVIPSELGKMEVLHPDAKQRVCGVFKGQLVYRRSDVSTMRSAKKWLYLHRKVREEEIQKPIKNQNKRQKPTTKGFKALRSYGVGEGNDGNETLQIQQGTTPLDDGTENLYGIWQTDPWSPKYVGPNDEIPRNEFRNIELALLNPGLVHIDQTGLAVVAKKLGIPYVPCLLGFEGHGGNRTPTVRGIVVHEHNAQIIREAGVEVQSYEIEQECNDRRRSLLLSWKRLMVGLLTKDRLDREYGQEKE